MVNNLCRLCETESLTSEYSDLIRDGSFPNTVKGRVRRCSNCGVEKLDEEFCLEGARYDTLEYREYVGMGTSTADFLSRFDPIQIHNLDSMKSVQFRDKLVADVGAGGGSFLDHIASLAKSTVAIEPTTGFHSSLQERGHHVFNYTKDALSTYRSKLDVVVSFQVLEHVFDPIIFLQEITSLLKPGGTLAISTPNTNDILLNLCPETFQSFYYRTQHRWYFDKKSLDFCFNRAVGEDFASVSVDFQHTLGLSNTLFWLRDKQPRGSQTMDAILPSIDSTWSAYLKSTAQADTLFLLATKY